MRGRSLFPTLWSSRDVTRKGFEPFMSLQHEIDRVFDDFGRGFRMPGWGDLKEPRVDVAETDNDIQVTAELPGVSEKEIDVSLSDGLLTIKGEKHGEKEEKGKEFRMVERSYGSFMRTIPMPYDVDPEAVDAKFEDGVLKLILPKPAEARHETKKIEIKH